MQAKVQVVLIGDLDVISEFLRCAPRQIQISTSPSILDDDSTTISDLIQNFIAAKQLTAASFARRVGCDKATICRIVERNGGRRTTESAIRTYIKENV